MAITQKEYNCGTVASEVIRSKLRTISDEVKDYYSTKKARDDAESKKYKIKS